jgi:hypothetical protein
MRHASVAGQFTGREFQPSLSSSLAPYRLSTRPNSWLRPASELHRIALFTRLAGPPISTNSVQCFGRCCSSCHDIPYGTNRMEPAKREELWGTGWLSQLCQLQCMTLPSCSRPQRNPALGALFKEKKSLEAALQAPRKIPPRVVGPFKPSAQRRVERPVSRGPLVKV